MPSATRKRVLALALLLALSACATPAPQALARSGAPADSSALRTLVLMMDGVPYDLVDSLWRAGHFRGFQPPSRLVSAFPSLTGVAFRGIWQELPTPGYEDRYFDPGENRLRGGLLEHLFRSEQESTFHRFVEVQPSRLAVSLAYLLPGPLARAELRRLREETDRRAAYDSTIVAYLVSTDALAHRGGRDELATFLVEVDAMLAEIRARHGAGLRIVMFSDHGNDLVPTRRVPLDEALDAAGFRSASRIESERDVVVPRFGLVGSSFLYALPAAEPRIAEALLGVEGVDLVVFADELGRVHVWNTRGRALVEATPDRSAYRYRMIQGDPLGFAPVLERLHARAEVDSNGFAPDSAWFRETLPTPYVDAPRRILQAVGTAVRYPANVIVSYEPGFHYGNAAADLVVPINGTHGSLRTSSSIAFFMSTHVATPPALRGEELQRYLRLPAR